MHYKNKVKRDNTQHKCRYMHNLNADYFLMYNNVLMYTQRFVLPAILEKCLLREIHIDHPGISGMISLMSSYIYLTIMN